MAWPFSSVVAPNVDTGFAPVAQDILRNPPNADSVTPYWLMGANFANPSDADEYLTLADGSGAVAIPTMAIPAHSTLVLEWPFMPITGLLWFATGPVTGKVWGYA